MRPLLGGLIIALLSLHASGAFAGEVATAARSGDVEKLIQLLDDGAPADEPGAAHPLHFACLSGQIDAARLLLERGADANAASILGTPLMIAAARKKPDIVGLLLLHGADPDLAGGREDRTPLHEAAFAGTADIVQVLLDRDADAMARTKHGETPLHLAVLKGHGAVANLLRPETHWTPPTPPTDADLSKSDVEAGRIAIGNCEGCHGLELGVTEEGPSLWSVFERDRASLEGYAYSTAMRATGGSWDAATLDAFLADPMMAVPGTSMNRAQVADRETRWALIAYLRTLR